MMLAYLTHLRHIPRTFSFVASASLGFRDLVALSSWCITWYSSAVRLGFFGCWARLVRLLTKRIMFCAGVGSGRLVTRVIMVDNLA